MKRRLFLETLPVISTSFAYSCVGQKHTISVDENFFVNTPYISDIDSFEYILNGKIVYLHPNHIKNPKLEQGKKYPCLKAQYSLLKALEIIETNETYKGKNIYNIEKVFLTK